VALNTIAYDFNTGTPVSEPVLALTEGLGAGTVINRIQGTIWGSWGPFAIEDTTPALVNGIGAGVVFIPHGSSPTGYQDAQGQAYWIVRNSVRSTFSFLDWAPDSAVAEYYWEMTVELRWIGALKLAAESDLWCYVGGEGPTSPTLLVTGVIQVGYSGVT
jgi:hypothetical protein